MEDLPALFVAAIFGCVDSVDLQAARLVCRSWRDHGRQQNQAVTCRIGCPALNASVLRRLLLFPSASIYTLTLSHPTENVVQRMHEIWKQAKQVNKHQSDIKALVIRTELKVPAQVDIRNVELFSHLTELHLLSNCHPSAIQELFSLLSLNTQLAGQLQTLVISPQHTGHRPSNSPAFSAHAHETHEQASLGLLDVVHNLSGLQRLSMPWCMVATNMRYTSWLDSLQAVSQLTQLQQLSFTDTPLCHSDTLADSLHMTLANMQYLTRLQLSLAPCTCVQPHVTHPAAHHVNTPDGGNDYTDHMHRSGRMKRNGGDDSDASQSDVWIGAFGGALSLRSLQITSDYISQGLYADLMSMNYLTSLHVNTPSCCTGYQPAVFKSGLDVAAQPGNRTYGAVLSTTCCRDLELPIGDADLRFLSCPRSSPGMADNLQHLKLSLRGMTYGSMQPVPNPSDPCYHEEHVIECAHHAELGDCVLSGGHMMRDRSERDDAVQYVGGLESLALLHQLRSLHCNSQHAALTNQVMRAWCGGLPHLTSLTFIGPAGSVNSAINLPSLQHLQLHITPARTTAMGPWQLNSGLGSANVDLCSMRMDCMLDISSFPSSLKDLDLSRVGLTYESHSNTTGERPAVLSGSDQGVSSGDQVGSVLDRDQEFSTALETSLSTNLLEISSQSLWPEAPLASCGSAVLCGSDGIVGKQSVDLEPEIVWDPDCSMACSTVGLQADMNVVIKVEPGLMETACVGTTQEEVYASAAAIDTYKKVSAENVPMQNVNRVERCVSLAPEGSCATHHEPCRTACAFTSECGMQQQQHASIDAEPVVNCDRPPGECKDVHTPGKDGSCPYPAPKQAHCMASLRLLHLDKCLLSCDITKLLPPGLRSLTMNSCRCLGAATHPSLGSVMQCSSSLRSLYLIDGSWRGVAIEEGDWKLLSSHGKDLQDLHLGCLVPGSLPNQAVAVLEGLHGLKRLALRCGSSSGISKLSRLIQLHGLQVTVSGDDLRSGFARAVVREQVQQSLQADLPDTRVQCYVE